MKGRLLRGLLGVLLPIPLVGLALLLTRTPRSSELNAQTVPMLSREQRREMLTYQRSCERPEDCQSPLACFMEPNSGAHYCSDSECMNDPDCKAGFVCRAFKSVKSNRIVHQCEPLGLRQEGEPCDLLPMTRQRGCMPGLFCERRWCGRPCALNDPSSCPQGSFCAQGVNGPSCLPTCEGRACADGEECVSFGEKTSICAEIHGQDCERTGCPSGQVCSTEGISDSGDAVWRTCRVLCGGNHPACAAGSVCHIFRCRPACDPEAPNPCGSHRQCARRLSTDPWTCLPDL